MLRFIYNELPHWICNLWKVTTHITLKVKNKLSILYKNYVLSHGFRAGDLKD